MTPHLSPPDSALLTIEEFERLPEEGYRLELVRGQVVRDAPAGHRHSRIALRTAAMLDAFARERGLGEVTGADGGYVLFDDPPTVRAPDAAFVRRERLTSAAHGYPRLAPDLAVEVLSPSNTVTQIHAKVLDYLDAGSRLVWVVDPELRSVTVYRSRDEIRILGENDVLDGEDVLPGFGLEVRELFAC